MYLTAIMLPFFSFCSSSLFGRFIGFKGASRLPTTCLLITFLFSIFIFYEVSILGCNTYIKLISWVDFELLNIDWGFMFDSLTVIMFCIITFVSFLVHLYSTEYMQHDPHLPRFMSYLSLFTFFMLILVFSDNFIQMFVGWEGVGGCSYLLINLFTFIGIYLFVRVVVGKSVQLGFHTWLQDALKGSFISTKFTFKVGLFVIMGIVLVYYFHASTLCENSTDHSSGEVDDLKDKVLPFWEKTWCSDTKGLYPVGSLNYYMYCMTRQEGACSSKCYEDALDPKIVHHFWYHQRQGYVYNPPRFSVFKRRYMRIAPFMEGVRELMALRKEVDRELLQKLWWVLQSDDAELVQGIKRLWYQYYPTTKWNVSDTDMMLRCWRMGVTRGFVDELILFMDQFPPDHPSKELGDFKLYVSTVYEKYRIESYL